MQGGIRAHLRANLVGYVALFVALSGGAYAAGLQKNSVKSKHIKNGHVRTADLAASAVNGSKVASDSLTGADIAEQALGQVPSAADADTLDSLDSDDFVQAGEAGAITPGMLAPVPAARAYGPRDDADTCSNGQSIANDAETPLRFFLESFDTDSLHDDACSPQRTRLVAPRAGVYVATASIVWPDTDADGRRSLGLVKNGITYLAQEAYPAAAGQPTLQSVSTVVRLAANNWVEALAHQNSGSTLQLDHQDERNNMTLVWLGP